MERRRGEWQSFAGLFLFREKEERGRQERGREARAARAEHSHSEGKLRDREPRRDRDIPTDTQRLTDSCRKTDTSTKREKEQTQVLIERPYQTQGQSTPSPRFSLLSTDELFPSHSRASQTHVYTCARTHTCMHTHMHAHTQMHTCKCTHKLTPAFEPLLLSCPILATPRAYAPEAPPLGIPGAPKDSPPRQGLQHLQPPAPHFSLPGAGPTEGLHVEGGKEGRG